MILPKPQRRGPKPRRRIARTSKSAQARQRRRSTAAWARSVRERAAGWCELCHGPGTDAHHVFGKKAHPELRYDLDNGIFLDRMHHVVAHQQPDLFRAWFARFSPSCWERLQARLA